VRIDLCGVRGSTPAPGRDFERYGGHTSCVALSHDGAEVPALILDAGTGVRAASRLVGRAPFAGTLLLSHLHWDHIQGLPFFSAGDREGSRVSVVLPEQPGGADALAVLKQVMSPPFFPVGPDELRGSWQLAGLAPGESEHEGFQVLALEIPHKGGRTYGFRVSDGHSVVTYMPDHCPTALGPGPDGYGEYHDAALVLAADSDVVIHDAQLLPSELGAEAWMGHSCGEYAVGLARRAGARSALLFHHKPNRTDAELDAIAAGLSGEPTAKLSVQGTTLHL
jgi:phosphoribosyl 1,2-cyclic phosphodiesterase